MCTILPVYVVPDTCLDGYIAIEHSTRNKGGISKANLTK